MQGVGGSNPLTQILSLFSRSKTLLFKPPFVYLGACGGYVADCYHWSNYMTSSNNGRNHWSEDPEERQSFLDLVNLEGFLLEDAVAEILSSSRYKSQFQYGEVFE